MPPFVPFVHGISTKRMECGSFFCGMLFLIGGNCVIDDNVDDDEHDGPDVSVATIPDDVDGYCLDDSDDDDGIAFDVDATVFSNGCIWRR